MRRENPFDPNEIQPFVEAAQRKKLSLLFGANKPSERQLLGWVEMDLVRISIENAIVRAKKQKITPLVERLERLLGVGSAIEQVGFVLGSGPTYYFAEDVKKLVDAGPRAAMPFSLQKFSWLRCWSLDPHSQVCEEHDIQICMIFQ